MQRWFGNISVTMKLAIGFGLVILLAFLLAAASWTGLNSVVKRTDRMADISTLTSNLTDLRIARLQYLLSNGGAAQADSAKQNLRSLIQGQQQILPNFKSPENTELLMQQIALAEQYQEAFGRTQAAFAAANGALSETTKLANDAEVLVQRISDDVLRSQASDESRFRRYQAISEFGKEMLKLRFHALNYVNNVNDDTKRVLDKQLELVEQGRGRLSGLLGSQYRERLQDLDKALDSYGSLLKGLDAVFAERAQLRETMAEQANGIDDLGDKLAESQMRLRDRDSDLAISTLTITALLALLVGVLSAWGITHQITKPLRDTLKAVEHIANGDLTKTIQVDRRDELGVLQLGIQRMGTTLRELISGIRDGVTQIASAAEELSAVTEQTSAGVNSQKMETDQVATAMQEMSATVQEVARNAAAASQAAVDTDREAAEGDRLVADAVSQIETLAAEVLRSVEAMSHLQTESKKIGGVMDVIKTVAEQTNLLALNAAIEAARAGEAGRGFAVVADEVRGLAQRTQKSTEEIEELVAGIDKGTRQVATIMQASRDMTTNSVALTRQAGSALGVITGKVSNIQEMNQQIAAAAEQQGAVAEEISRSIVNVRDISEQTASASEETAASSVELARLGGELQTMVSRFRV